MQGLTLFLDVGSGGTAVCCEMTVVRGKRELTTWISSTLCDVSYNY